MDLPVDHLVFACSDLPEGVRLVEALLGVTASPGGRHEGRGTHNALVGLGADAYLEIVAPDPSQPEPERPRWFGLDTRTETRLVTWCARAGRLEDVVARATAAGVELGSVTDASRRRPDGSTLAWSFTDAGAPRLDGLVPFFIDWSGARHPAEDLPQPCRLVDLVAYHPAPARIRAALSALGLGLTVRPGDGPRLLATLESPNGVVDLA